jgi:hypothetical protein
MLIILETGLAEEQRNAHRDLWFTLLNSDRTTDAVREALAAINSYTRTAVREESFMHRILPTIPIDNMHIELVVP